MQAEKHIWFTGHPLMDVAVAGVCVFCEREQPESVTLDDLDKVSDYMIETYYDELLTPYLSCVFLNAAFLQPKITKEKSLAFQSEFMRAHRSKSTLQMMGQACIFSKKPASTALNRTHFPLFSGENIVNFRPSGQSWLPVSGPFATALLFLPMACRRSEGKMLAVHAEDPSLTLRFARTYLEDNRRILDMQLPLEKAPFFKQFEREQPMWDQVKKRYKMADAKGPKSLVISDLAAIIAAGGPTDIKPHPTSVTAYLVSNSGQEPSLVIFELPSPLVSFVRKAQQPATRRAWLAITRRFRPLIEKDDQNKPQARKSSRRSSPDQTISIEGRAGWTKNPAFEELGDIFSPGFVDCRQAGLWLRRYVLGRMDKKKHPPTYEALESQDWSFAALFLREVMGMQKARIEAIRSFADKIAAWIHAKHDKRLYRALFWEKHTHEVRRRLLQAQRQSAESDLLFGLDEYHQVWLQTDENRTSENLVRDLICIRVVERLYELGYYSLYPDELPEEQTEEPAEDIEKRPSDQKQEAIQ